MDELLERAKALKPQRCLSPNGSGGQTTNMHTGVTTSWSGPSWPCGMCHACQTRRERELIAELVEAIEAERA